MELEKFDLEKAKAGRKVVTKTGLPVEILKWDIKNKYCISGFVTISNDSQVGITWTIDGFESETGAESDKDLFLASEERYINLYDGAVRVIFYDNLKEAKEIGLIDNDEFPKYLGTYKLVKV